MSTNILETFRAGRFDGYTYAQLLEIRAAGHEVPTNVLARVKQHEDADAEARELSDALAADLAAAEKARAKELADKDKTVLPKLKEMADELTELKTDAEDKRTAALAAVKEYRAAYRAASGKFWAIRRDVKSEYGEPVRGDDGNAVPGQTAYAHWVSHDVYLKDELVTPPVLATEFDSQWFRGL